ncbi:MAG: acetylxylan esterase [Lentisphaeria bacterium]|nr:acetylxylan esterase [Lentisphaeria bacterium]
MYVQQIPWVANYDENEVPPFVLPDPLKAVDGTPITSTAEWEANRAALLEQFRKIMYGRRLPLPDKVTYKVLHEKKNAVDGTAVMRQIELEFSMNNGRSHKAVMLLFIPSGANGEKPVPVFTGLTFHGNHVISDDPDIIVTGVTGEEFRSFDRTPGAQTRRFPLKEFMERNFALAICSYHDFFPDACAGWKKSILPLFLSDDEFDPRPEDMSAISVWAWGLSRMLDCLETVPEIDASKAAVFGHSRLGKTALWAGAEDTRFKLVCVNDSGCGGAAPNRRLYGETLFCMCRQKEDGFGHYWFTHTMYKDCEAPEKLPIDQHQLIALIAPRAVAVHSATEDQWADPRGEYMSLYNAPPVYALYGKEVLTSAEPPAPEVPVGTDMSYYLREGKHDMVVSDWRCYMDAFDHALKG